MNGTNTSEIDVALLITVYYASLGNATSSSRRLEFLTPAEVESVLTISNTNRIVSAAGSYLIVLPTVENNDLVTGISFEENYLSQTIRTSNQNLQNSNFTAAVMYDPQSAANALQLNALVINEPSDYRTITDSSDQKLMSPVIITILKSKTSSVSFANVSLIFRLTTTDVPVSQLVCAYYDANSSDWSTVGCTPPVKNSNRYECFCSDTLWSTPEPSSASGKYRILFRPNYV